MNGVIIIAWHSLSPVRFIFLSEPEEQKSVQFESNYNKSFSPDLMCQKHLVTRAIYFMCACLRYIAISVPLWYSPGISLDLNS